MWIGIDGGCWSNQRGYGRFLRELLRALGQVGASHHYTVYLDSGSYPLFDLEGPFEARRVATRQGVGEAATAESHRSLGDLLRMSLAVLDPLDLFFFPSAYSFFPLLRPIPTIVGIHDTIADRNPQFSFSSRQQLLFWRLKMRLAIVQADTILTVSEYSKRSIAEWFGVPATRIAVMREAAALEFERQDVRTAGPSLRALCRRNKSKQESGASDSCLCAIAGADTRRRTSAGRRPYLRSFQG